ncbi:MAG TPA: hypothetical protein VE077_21655 [Candidatus Methylomirabilis sp.]|nr:hypothetical protein [Candidatus Methylomirabilis sp.]
MTVTHFLSISGVRGLLVSVGIFLVLCVWEWFAIPRGAYTFEPRGPGSFEPTLVRYSRLTEFIVGLATGSIVLLAGTSMYRSNGRLPQLYGSPLTLLAMSVVWLVLFISCTTFFYEDWLHHPQNQTHRRYRLSVAFGFSGLLSFAVGYVWLAFALMGY